MKNLGLVILFVLGLSACGNHSDSHSDAPSDPPGKPTATKHIEKGTHLIFSCADTFHNSTVVFVSAWNDATSKWDTSAEEFDSSGNTISKIDHLEGQPDAVQDWKMNITDATGPFAQIWQSGSDQALCRARDRTMNCTFN